MVLLRASRTDARSVELRPGKPLNASGVAITDVGRCRTTTSAESRVPRRSVTTTYASLGS